MREGRAKSLNTRRMRWALFAASFIAFACIVGWKVRQDYLALPPIPRADDLSISKVVLDRNKVLLRAFISQDDKWRLPVELDEVDPLYFKMLLAFEDRRFYGHPGVDIRALVRAAAQSLKAGKVVSGGSTLTMQVARLIDERPTRTLWRKYRQILRAIQLNQNTSKQDVLKLYALRAPFGGNIEGVRAASLSWFGKEPRRLTPAEAALLVAMPQSPERRRPDMNRSGAQEARNRVLAKALEEGVLSEEEANSASAEPVLARKNPLPFLAAHESREAVRGSPRQAVHHLTLESGVQRRLEDMVKRKAETIPAPVSIAVLVANHQSGDVIASIGSPDLLDSTRQGHIDMTRAIRSPGSALKPFIYGLAFEEGVGFPDSLIVDRPIDFGGYKPANFDRAYQGTVTLAEALKQSLNTPAIQLLEAIGPSRLFARLKRAGARPVLTKKGNPGLAVGLGGVGVSLSQLVAAYGSLGHGGKPVTLKTCAKSCPSKRKEDAPQKLPVLAEKAALQINSILLEMPQSVSASGVRIAYKTGTSYGYRDAWAVGYDGRNVIGVWVGRPDGSPIPGQTGATAAVPVLFEAFQKLGTDLIPLAEASEAQMATLELQNSASLKFARVANRKNQTGSETDVRIAFPPDSATLEVADSADGSLETQILKVEGGKPPFRLLINGAVSNDASFGRQIIWRPQESGYADITVLDSKGRSDRISVRLANAGN